MRVFRDLRELVSQNPRLAIAAATGDVLVALVTTLIVLAVTGNLF